MVVSTKNFHPDNDPKLLCTCGHPKCHKPSVNQETLNIIQLIRDDYGKPIYITSGGRCEYHPDQAGKANPLGGDHPEGNGVDIAVTNKRDYDTLAMLAGRHGFNAIGDGLKKGFIHLARRLNNGTRISTWGY